MSERATIIVFLTVVVFYYFWRFRSLHLLLTKRIDKRRISLKTGFEAVIAITAITLFWKWDIGFPWSVALVFALILAVGIVTIGLLYYLLYWRHR